MKFTSIVITLSAVIAMTQVAALPTFPQELGPIPGNLGPNIGYISDGVLTRPTDKKTKAVEISSLSTPLTKRQNGPVDDPKCLSS